LFNVFGGQAAASEDVLEVDLAVGPGRVLILFAADLNFKTIQGCAFFAQDFDHVDRSAGCQRNQQQFGGLHAHAFIACGEDHRMLARICADELAAAVPCDLC
jgi:hypothetical protein